MQTAVLHEGTPVSGGLAPRIRRHSEWGWLIIALCVGLTVYIALVPLGFLLWQSFFTPHTAYRAAEFTFGNYQQAYGSTETLRLFWNSVKFAFGTSLLAFVIGTGLAWMNERTNTPFKHLFFALSIIPLIIPGILFTVAWILLASPKIGIINLVLKSALGIDGPLFDIYSMGGMIWVDGLHYSPMAFLLMSAAFRAMDPALEESAMTLLLITTAGVYFQSRLSGRGSRYATMTGKGFRPRQIDLGGWRWATAAIFLGYFLLIVVLPFAVLLWSSFQRFYSVPSWQALQNLTLDPYRFILTYPNLTRSVWNSLLLAIGSATLIMLVASVICWIVVKTKLRGRWLLDNIASLPMVFPGLVLGLSIMIFYLHFDIGVYGTMWIMFIAYLTRFMPHGLRYSTTSMLQIHKELEESSAMAGASWGTTFRRIILPLLKPGLVAGWIYVMIVSIRELSSSILLYSPGTEVLSIVIWELWENGQFVELSALGVLFILALFAMVMIAQWLSKKFGVKGRVVLGVDSLYTEYSNEGG